MSIYDPRIVAQALGDLQDQLTRWSSIASETLAAATETQRHAKEAADRAMHNAAILLNRAQDDEESVQKAISSVEVAIEKCVTAKSTANQTLQEAQTILKLATATLQKWEAELEKALAWLARAEARLDKAIREYDRARRALSSAEWDLSSAESRYRNCMNNPERRDCGSEAAAVRRAQADVASARTWVAIAEQEVIAAKEEVEQAKARVACCQEAVAFATQAVNLAQEAESDATQAVNSAERGLEFAQAAERLIRVAQDKVAAEVEAAESMMTDTRAAFSLTDEAAIHLRTADAAEDSAQAYATTARKELAHRMQLLYELNKPTLYDEGQGTVSSSPSPQSTTGKIHYHHIYPQQYRGFFEGLGINIDQWTVAVDEKIHLKYIHSESKWNEMWKAWIEEHEGEVTADEVLKFGRKSLTHFGLEGLWEGDANPNPSYEIPEGEVYHRPPTQE